MKHKRINKRSDYNTAQKIKFTEEILNGKLHFLCSINVMPVYLPVLAVPY